MNAQQKLYTVAKAYLETLKDEELKIERDYMLQHNIVNKNGNTPYAVYTIDNQVTFDKANREIADIIEDSGLWASIIEAEKSLKEAEEELITFGLSIMPSKNLNEKKALEISIKENFTARLKLLNLIIKLDTITI